MRPLRVLILTHNYPISSSERRNAGIFVHDFAKELIKQGVEVYVFCPSATKNVDKVDGIPVYWFTWGRKNRNFKELKLWNPFDLINLLVFFYKGITESLRFALKIKPDYCISMWAIPSGVFAYAIKKRYKTPYCVWILGSDVYVYARFPIVGQVIKIILKRANHLMSDGLDLCRKVSALSKRNCKFLASGTNFDVNTKVLVSRKNKKIVLSFIGRMEQEKGPDLLVEAILNVDESVQRKLKINFIGDGSLLQELKNKVEKNNLTSMFKFYGNIDDKNEIFNILHNSDWFVVPSRSDSIPLVFSEGMKAGTPIISSSLPDLKYLVNKYNVGLCFKSNDIKSLVKVLSNLPLKIKRDIMAKNTTKAAEDFTLKSSVGRFLEIIKK